MVQSIAPTRPVLSAASAFFKNLLGGSFLEAERVQQKQPVEIAASKAAVSALLDYIYDGQPESISGSWSRTPTTGRGLRTCQS